MRKRVGGVGGLIMVNKNGEWAATCTTKRMAWACVDNGALYSGVTNGSSTPYKPADIDMDGTGVPISSAAEDEADTTGLGPAGRDMAATFSSFKDNGGGGGGGGAAADDEGDLLS